LKFDYWIRLGFLNTYRTWSHSYCCRSGIHEFQNALNAPGVKSRLQNVSAFDLVGSHLSSSLWILYRIVALSFNTAMNNRIGRVGQRNFLRI